MNSVSAFGVRSATDSVSPLKIERRNPGPNDVVIQVEYCGICHSDIHQVRNEWGGSTYPMVPGHEIVGHVTAIGKKVKKFKVGQPVGVGCFVDSCRKCAACKDHEEQYCEVHTSYTYSSTEQDKKTPTYGGYSRQIVVDQNYVLKISPKLPLDKVAPLLCAGITTYSPLKKFGVKKGNKVAVVGLGGLGHMGVKLAKAMGAEVTVLSTSMNKEKDARRLGAKYFYSTKDEKTFSELAGHFHFILDTVSASHDVNAYLNLLRRNGTMILVGVPPEATPVHAHTLIGKRRRLVGSLIGGIKETQEMLDFCAKKKIVSDVEVIPAQKINEAYERTLKGDVKFRFVIDCSTI